MKDIKYVIIEFEKHILGVVDAVELDDGTWLLIDKYKDLDRLFGFSFGWERVSEENIIGCFQSFEDLKKFLKKICDNCELTWI